MAVRYLDQEVREEHISLLVKDILQSPPLALLQLMVSQSAKETETVEVAHCRQQKVSALEETGVE